VYTFCHRSTPSSQEEDGTHEYLLDPDGGAVEGATATTKALQRYHQRYLEAMNRRRMDSMTVSVAHAPRYLTAPRMPRLAASLLPVARFVVVLRRCGATLHYKRDSTHFVLAWPSCEPMNERRSLNGG
jgi:hypothetical protein